MIADRNKTANFSRLLGTLVVLFVAQPLVVYTGMFASSLVNLTLIVALAVATTSVSGKTTVRAAVYSMGMVAFLSSWASIILGLPWLELIVYVSYLAFFGVVCANVLGHVLDGSEINANKLYAVCCVYLLAGIAWAFLYGVVEILAPGSFNLPATDGNPTRFIQPMIYFSLVTLTTLGYGDIVPVSEFARTVASLEAIFGQAYLAVLVARLMGWRLSPQPSGEDKNSLQS